MQRRVYFDSASTTNIHPEVLKTYEEVLEKYYVNSESLYDEGAQVRRMMERSRTAAAELLGVKSDEVLFTSGSSESNSLAIKGVAFAHPEKKHIITTQIEHSSVLNCCRQMERVFGYRVTYLPVTESGVIKTEDLRAALCPDTVLVSIMLVNNETGAISPMDEIKEYVKKQSHAYLHSDLTQAFSKVDCDLENIDLASLSAHKLEGLKGSGILIKKRFVELEPLINGGEQEWGIRGGTANAPADIVFAKTLRLALENHRRFDGQIKALHDHLLERLAEIEGIELNSPRDGVSATVNFSCEKIPSEVMQNALNRKGFMVSARSTCESNSNNPSYVLQAMGFSDRRASCSIRVSLSRHNTMEEVDAFCVVLKEIIEHYG